MKESDVILKMKRANNPLKLVLGMDSVNEERRGDMGGFLV